MSSYATEFGEFGELASEAGYGEFESQGEAAVNPLTEAQETQLASELLEISSEAELEQFFGSLISNIGRAAGNFIKSPIGRALGGIAKDVAKKALPMVGGALGSMVAPGIGTALGSQLGSWASGLFELELESMPQEQAEFEIAKRVVGLTAAAANKAALAPPMPGVSPEKLARAAITEAARDYAPGLFRMLKQSAAMAGGPSPSGLADTRVPDMRSGMRRVPPGPGGRMPPGRRARAYGGDFWDVPEEPSDADWGADGSVAFARAGTRRPTAGRWVRRGRRIVLLGI